MIYTILDEDKVPEVLKNKPKWVTCVAFMLALFMLVTLAITVGIVIGYTYCYIEHRTGIRTVNTESSNYRLTRRIPQESNVVKGNRTINGAIMSSLLVSRILTIGHALMEEELSHLPWVNKVEEQLRAR